MAKADPVKRFSGPIHLYLRIQVSEQRQSELLDFLRDAVPYYEAPGGTQVRFLQSRDHPDRFMEVIEYDSPESFDQDQQRVVSDTEMPRYLERWRALLDAAAEVEPYYDLTDQIHRS